jgi:hypothetical protein
LIIIKKEQFKKARKEMPKRKAQRDFKIPHEPIIWAPSGDSFS